MCAGSALALHDKRQPTSHHIIPKFGFGWDMGYDDADGVAMTEEGAEDVDEDEEPDDAGESVDEEG